MAYADDGGDDDATVLLPVEALKTVAKTMMMMSPMTATIYKKTMTDDATYLCVSW